MTKLTGSLFAFLLLFLLAAIFTAGCGLFGSDSSKGVFGKENSFAVDSSGCAHTVYTASSGLRYATNKTGRWEIETLATGYISSPALAVDSAGHCHVVYYDETNRACIYATNTTGSWVMQTIQTEIYSVFSHALALDSSSTPRIVLTEIPTRDYSYDQLAYITLSGGAWNVSCPIASTVIITKAALALDANDNPCILYLNDRSNDIILARLISGSWTTEAVVNIGDNTGHTDLLALAVTSMDCFSILYNDHTYASIGNSSLKFASREASSAWKTGYIDLYADFACLATDSNKTSHLFYRKSNNLKYATNLTGTWSQEVLFVDSGQVGVSSYGDVSVCLDNSGNLQGVYFEDTSRSGTLDPIVEGRLQYFTNRSGTWEREVVDEGP